jgi:hypothetical protein
VTLFSDTGQAEREIRQSLTDAVEREVRDDDLRDAVCEPLGLESMSTLRPSSLSDRLFSAVSCALVVSACEPVLLSPRTAFAASARIEMRIVDATTHSPALVHLVCRAGECVALTQCQAVENVRREPGADAPVGERVISVASS